MRARSSIAPRGSALALLLALTLPARAVLGWGGVVVEPAPAAAPAPAPAAPAVPAASMPAPTAASPAAASTSDVEGPMRPEAAALYKSGLERFAARDYAAAVAELEGGFALDPRREFLFAEGQAKRLAGDCKGAVALYQRFLATGPSAVQANAAQIALGRCAQHMADHPEVVVVQSPRPPPPPPPAPPRWWHDPFGLGFSGAGVVGIGIGVGFMAASFSARHDAENAGTYNPYDGHWSTAESRWNVAVGTLALGTALAAVGVARFVLVRRHLRESEKRMAVWVGPGGLQFGGAF